MSALLTITAVAKRSGVAASALRYYEERGLISSERAGSGHRRYPRPVLRRIAFIVFAQRVGLSLDEIAEVLRAVVPRVELRAVRPRTDPVVMRGITLVPRHGTEVEVVRRRAARARRTAEPQAVGRSPIQ